jgi:hypothetical protein
VASQPLEVGLPPPVAEQERELSLLLAQLGKAASYGEKVGCNLGGAGSRQSRCPLLAIAGGAAPTPLHP